MKTKKQNIEFLFGKVQVKYKAIKAVSDATGVSFLSVKNNWLSKSGNWSVPEKYQTQVIETLQKVIFNQK